MQSFILLNSLYRSIKDKVTCISEIKNTLFIALMTNVIWLMMTSLFIFNFRSFLHPCFDGFPLYYIVYFYRDNAQLKVIAPELADG